jgi:hypothetical protein
MNGAFLLSIGNLIVNWANNQSVFLAMLQALVGGGAHALKDAQLVEDIA